MVLSDDFHAPSPVSADTVAPSCGAADGAQGVVDPKGVHCCPLGCGVCGGTGCGQVPTTKIFPDGRELPEGIKSSAYCCITEAFTNSTSYCDEAGVEPPCLVRDGTFVVRGRAVGRLAGCWGEWGFGQTKKRCVSSAAAAVMFASLPSLVASFFHRIARASLYLRLFNTPRGRPQTPQGTKACL